MVRTCYLSNKIATEAISFSNTAPCHNTASWAENHSILTLWYYFHHVINNHGMKKAPVSNHWHGLWCFSILIIIVIRLFCNSFLIKMPFNWYTQNSDSQLVQWRHIITTSNHAIRVHVQRSRLALNLSVDPTRATYTTIYHHYVMT